MMQTEGDYQLNSLLSFDIIEQGRPQSFGQIFKARHRGDGNFYSIAKYDSRQNKDLLDGRTQSADETRNYFPITNHSPFAIEQALERVNHMQSLLPHVSLAPIVGSFVEDDFIYIVTPYPKFGTLEDYIVEHGRDGPIEESIIQNIIIQLAIAISHLHANGFLHRGINLSNIYFTEGSKFAIQLGGFSVVNFDHQQFDLKRQRPAPELLRKRPSPYSEKSESWNLGVVAYALACRQMPDSLNFNEITISETYSSLMKDFISRLLERDPRRRLSASAALGHRFLNAKLSQNYLKGRELSAPKPSARGLLPAQLKLGDFGLVRRQNMTENLPKPAMSAMKRAYLTEPCLHMAAFNGDLMEMERLIELGENIDAKLANGKTPLGMAVAAKQVDAVEFLLKKGADVNLVKRPLYLVRGRDKGRAAWHYVAVKIEKYREFINSTIKGGNVNISEFSEIVQSGWGDGPPPDVEEQIKKKYGDNT